MAGKEFVRKPVSGYVILVLELVLVGIAAWMLSQGIEYRSTGQVLGAVFAFVLFIFALPGFIVVQPNQAVVLLLFGAYHGSVKHYGFWWVNPFVSKRKLSLRARNLEGEKLKVNDLVGNPIEIAAVVVWRIDDTFAACFEVDNYEHYVTVQGDSALRHLAKAYPYDEPEGGTISLRGSTDEVSDALRQELQERLQRAGVIVDEARLSHLAYAPEIASAMLQRQQAEAIISARRRIVEGAVSMVEMALDQLGARKMVQLDEERRAQMVSNLLVVLTSERVTPVINAGTLYS
ncbi:MAG TPA: SPFH domain-containing protein [Candidatus Krumholzibacteria bacterium]|nr:SPFH domain-containing protein [Candidatus Krumholzibacteria bacterium]